MRAFERARLQEALVESALGDVRRPRRDDAPPRVFRLPRARRLQHRARGGRSAAHAAFVPRRAWVVRARTHGATRAPRRALGSATRGRTPRARHRIGARVGVRWRAVVLAARAAEHGGGAPRGGVRRVAHWSGTGARSAGAVSASRRSKSVFRAREQKNRVRPTRAGDCFRAKRGSVHTVRAWCAPERAGGAPPPCVSARATRLRRKALARFLAADARARARGARGAARRRARACARWTSAIAGPWRAARLARGLPPRSPARAPRSCADGTAATLSGSRAGRREHHVPGSTVSESPSATRVAVAAVAVARGRAIWPCHPHHAAGAGPHGRVPTVRAARARHRRARRRKQYLARRRSRAASEADPNACTRTRGRVGRSRGRLPRIRGLSRARAPRLLRRGLVRRSRRRRARARSPRAQRRRPSGPDIAEARARRAAADLATERARTTLRSPATDRSPRWTSERPRAAHAKKRYFTAPPPR